MTKNKESKPVKTNEGSLILDHTNYLTIMIGLNLGRMVKEFHRYVLIWL